MLQLFNSAAEIHIREEKADPGKKFIFELFTLICVIARRIWVRYVELAVRLQQCQHPV